MILKRKKLSRGLTLVELMLAVSIISMAMIGILDYMERESQRQRAELAGEQLGMVGKAVEKMIVQEGSSFKACIPNNGIINIPLSALYTTGGTTTVGTCTITNRPYMAWAGAAAPINVFGSGYILQIKNQANGYITGLVTLDAPVREGNVGANVRYDWLGIAAKKIGANGGGTFTMTGANTMNGVGGGWSLTNVDFPIITQLGILGYKTSAGGELDNIYLRLDGAYPMRGDLNMGNFSINNVTDLNVNGWLNGNNALINNLKTSYIAANHIQTNTLNVTSTIATGGRNTNIRPTGWTGELVKVWDIISDGGSIGLVGGAGSTVLETLLTPNGLVAASGFQFNGRGDGAYYGSGANGGTWTRDGRGIYTGYLMDRLPRFVMRASTAVNSGALVSKPNCTAAQYSKGGGYKGKVIVTPIYQNVYPEYTVEVSLTPSNEAITQQSVTGRDQLQTYAIDTGGSWMVYGNSYMGQAYLGGVDHGRVLVQTFCDFED